MNKPIDLKHISTVLFDFDGVLMQSIEDHHRSWNEAFQKYHAEIGWEEFSILEGQSLYAIARQLCRGHGIDESESERIGRSKNEIYLQTASLKLYEGTFSLLDLLKEKRFSLALVTGAHRDRFEKSVNSHFLSYFNAIITADDVRQTKPNPEPFLKAASWLCSQADECLVIENAPLGIESAKSAGMLCIALGTTLTEKFLAKADLIVKDLNELKKFFEDIGFENTTGK